MVESDYTALWTKDSKLVSWQFDTEVSITVTKAPHNTESSRVGSEETSIPLPILHCIRKKWCEDDNQLVIMQPH